nr:hypothetical protein [Tanacetum cinerariifolium]
MGMLGLKDFMKLLLLSDATLYSSSLDESEESSNETDNADESDMDLSNDNLQGDDDATSKENSLSYDTSPTKLTTSQSKEADAKGKKEYEEDQLQEEESANETDNADESDMDLSNDNPQGDDDAIRYGVFMHNKSTVTPNSTYLSPSVTSSSLDFIQTFIDETPTNGLMDFMSYQVYTDAQKSLVVHNPEGNPKLTSYISSVSEVPLGTHVDVLATKTLQQEMFQDKNTHHIPSLPAKKIPYPTTHP